MPTINVMEIKDNKKISKWYYLTERRWFDNRKEAKDYLGGTLKFNEALKVKDIIYIQI